MVYLALEFLEVPSETEVVVVISERLPVYFLLTQSRFDI